MDTRDRILLVARRCFARQGFHGTSVDRIVGEAGISKGSLYWHFPGKFDIYRAVMESQAEALSRFFEPEPGGVQEAPVTFIIRKGMEQLEIFSGDPDLNCLWKSLHIEAMRGNAEFQDLACQIWKKSIDHLLPRFRDVFQDCRAVHEPVWPREVLESLGACFEGLVLQMGVMRTLGESKRLWTFSVHRIIEGGANFAAR